MVNGEGEPFAFEFITFRPPFKRTLLPYANALKRLGIEARIQLVDGAQLARRRRAREFDALLTERYFQSLPTVYLRTFWHSTAAGPGMMTANVTELVSPVVDQLIERAEQAESLDELVTVLRSLDRVVLWQFHSIPLGNVEDTRFLYWDRFGRPEAEAEARYQWPFVDGWWYDGQKAARADRSQVGAGGRLMLRYVVRRVLLIFPTLIGIVTINFLIVQFVPGGPVDQAIMRAMGQEFSATARIAGAQTSPVSVNRLSPSAKSQYAGAQGLDPELIAAIEKQFGFDRPLHERYFSMLADYLVLDLGESYFEGRTVLKLIQERLPVSMSLGLWSLLLIYVIAIPLGVVKAVRDGSRFDALTSAAIFVGYAVPSFLFAIFLIVLFAGGSYPRLVSAQGADLQQFRRADLHRQVGRLLPPSRAAGRGIDGWRDCDPDHAHQELVPGRGGQTIRDDRPGQGLDRPPGALRPRVP